MEKNISALTIISDDFVLIQKASYDSITKEEQLKFKELLKAKKISTFGLPKDTVIIVTYNNLNINEEIYGLMAHIKD